jgi:hypothetical protein
MFGHAGNTMCEIVEEPHDKGIGPFQLGAVGKMLGLVELTSGDHVALTCGCGKFAGGALSGTVGCHINSVQAKPHVLGHALT